VITITESAVKEIRSIILQEDKNDHNLRIGVSGVGCAGLQYFMGLDKDIRETDETTEFEGFKLLIDNQSLPFLKGATLDFLTDPKNSGFVFDNPNMPRPPECGGECCA